MGYKGLYLPASSFLIQTHRDGGWRKEGGRGVDVEGGSGEEVEQGDN